MLILKDIFAGITALYLGVVGIFSPTPITVTKEVVKEESTVVKELEATSSLGEKQMNQVSQEATKTSVVENLQLPSKEFIVENDLIKIKDEQASISPKEQEAINYFNRYGSCDNIATDLLSYCAKYSLNNVSIFEKERKEKLAAEADRLAVERAKKKEEEENLLNKKINDSPVECTYIRTTYTLNCQNLKTSEFIVDSFAFLLVSSAELNNKFTNGKFSPAVRIYDFENKTLFAGTIEDRTSKKVITNIVIKGNEEKKLTNENTLLRFDFCAEGVGCTKETDFEISFKSIEGRFNTGEIYTPTIKIQ